MPAPKPEAESGPELEPQTPASEPEAEPELEPGSPTPALELEAVPSDILGNLGYCSVA